MGELRLNRRILLGAPFTLMLPRQAQGRTRTSSVQINLADLPPTPPADATSVAAGADTSLRMSVPVHLNDQGPFTFVVDTGANRSVVAGEVATGLQLPSGPSARVHGIAGVESAETVQVDKLAVGAVSSRRLQLPILPRERLGAQGLLGVDVLENRHVVLNFLEHRLEVGPPRHEQMNDSAAADHLSGARQEGSVVTVPARYRFGQLTIVDADVGGLSVTAFLDSGSQNTVANLTLRNAALGRQPKLATRLTSVELLSATGQTAQGSLCPLPPLRLGGLTVEGLSAVFADLHTFDVWGLKGRSAILIGMDILRHFDAVELDFGRRRVVFHTPTSAHSA